MKNINSYLLIITLWMLSSPTYCSFGVTIQYADKPQESTLQCLKANLLTQNLLMAFEYDTGFDHLSPELPHYLNSLGMNITLVVAPCRSRDPLTSVRQLLTKLPKELFNSVSIMPPIIHILKKFGWSSSSHSKNCQHLNQIMQQFKKYNVSTSITSDAQVWESFFGGYCKFLGSQQPLIWLPSQADDSPSFNDFKSFGGWTSPIKKIYTLDQICGMQMLKVYWK